MKASEKSTANFDSNPPIALDKYDASMRQFCAAYESMFKMAYASLASVIKKDINLLVVGAGTGMEICTFSTLNPSWKITGVDPSCEMLSIAKQKINHLSLSNSITLFEGYTDDLPPSALFNAATCILVMHFLQDDGSKLNLLKSISSHLTSGAPFVIIDGFGDKNTESFESIVSAWKQYAVAMGADEAIVEDGFNNQILKRIQFIPENRINQLLEDAGFIKVSKFFTSFHYGGWLAIKN